MRNNFEQIKIVIESIQKKGDYKSKKRCCYLWNTDNQALTYVDNFITIKMSAWLYQ